MDPDQVAAIRKECDEQSYNDLKEIVPSEVWARWLEIWRLQEIKKCSK